MLDDGSTIIRSMYEMDGAIAKDRMIGWKTVGICLVVVSFYGIR